MKEIENKEIIEFVLDGVINKKLTKTTAFRILMSLCVEEKKDEENTCDNSS